MKKDVTLTSLELQILCAKGMGKTSKETSRELFGREEARRVDNMLSVVYLKLGVDSIVGAVRVAVDEIDAPDQTLGTVSEVQMQIAKYIAEGLSTTQIAFRMSFSIKNVEYHLGQIYKKTGCRNQAHLTAVYLKHHAK